LLKKFQSHIENIYPFLKEKKLLIANSGGVDSMVLTHLLQKLDYHITLAHCNFRLRGIASDLDEEFVQKEAEKGQMEFFVSHFKTKKIAKEKGLSIQMAARDLRYKWFDELIKEYKFDYLLTAHHADDNLETFLINLTRGTGLHGLTGIPSGNKNIIRPLLPFTRKEIEYYANSNNLEWREDRSNFETKYLRNKLRHEIIPVLKDLNPNFMETFAKTLENLKGSEEIIQDRIREIKNKIQIGDLTNDSIIKLSIPELRSLNNTKAYLFELLKDYGFAQWNDISDLLFAQSGKQIFSKTHRLIKDRDYLLLSELPEKQDPSEGLSSSNNRGDKGNELIEIYKGPKRTAIGNYFIQLKELTINELNHNLLFKHSKHSIFIDKQLLTFPLTVRKWEIGDYFYPIGMEGKKKLSKYFKDEKLSLLEKENIWLLCSENKIVWIIEKRLDNRFKVTENTKEIIQIDIVQ